MGACLNAKFVYGRRETESLYWENKRFLKSVKTARKNTMIYILINSFHLQTNRNVYACETAEAGRTNWPAGFRNPK
jgi:hypothetical protein